MAQHSLLVWLSWNTRLSFGALLSLLTYWPCHPLSLGQTYGDREIIDIAKLLDSALHIYQIAVIVTTLPTFPTQPCHDSDVVAKSASSGSHP